jgi:hypothetical protein
MSEGTMNWLEASHRDLAALEEARESVVPLNSATPDRLGQDFDAVLSPSKEDVSEAEAMNRIEELWWQPFFRE